ncbi:hypothetical protein NLJ89_g10518 [Agrocybe chaxingu]|uniref:Uncharacterized protein n=1 Tax=Agrocybe chaxingu TaxID=84603 RepID=A0A9W8JR09_9AGAR|nr:hypothetical protein NLJ89_g10518 [Agrocybe chaxingu]
MPILKNLTLDFSNQLRQAKVSIFWDRLTTLKLTSKMRSTEYLSILRLCVNLESCSISPKTRDDRDALKGSYEPVHLVKLKKLEIVSYWVPSLVAAQLVCPVLEEAIIQFEACYHEEAELVSFFKKCAATLQVLKVPGSFCRVDKWARPLENLQELTVTGGYDWDDVDSDHGATSFFTPLIVTRSRTLLPRLKIIRAVEQDKWSKHAVNAVLFEVVKSRMQGKRNLAKLQCIVFKMADRVEGKMDEYRRQYQKWETDGLKVDLND